MGTGLRRQEQEQPELGVSGRSTQSWVVAARGRSALLSRRRQQGFSSLSVRLRGLCLGLAGGGSPLLSASRKVLQTFLPRPKMTENGAFNDANNGSENIP